MTKTLQKCFPASNCKVGCGVILSSLVLCVFLDASELVYFPTPSAPLQVQPMKKSGSLLVSYDRAVARYDSEIQLSWSQELGGRPIFAQGAEDGRVFVGVAGTGVLALDQQGKQLWQKNIPGLRPLGVSFYQDRLYLVVDGALKILDRDGNEHGNHPVEAGGRSPVFDASGVGLLSQGEIFAGISSDGEVLWRIPLRNRASRVRADGGLFFAPDLTQITAVTTSGSRAWQCNLDPNSPDEISGLVVAPDGSLRAALGRSVYGISRDGQILWKTEAKETISGHEPLVCDSKSRTYCLPSYGHQEATILDASGRVMVKLNIGYVPETHPKIDAFNRVWFCTAGKEGIGRLTIDIVN